MDDTSDGTAEPAPELTADEQAAIRAYLQRSEVRLSTVHRVASALLSGAGLMVLLPAVERDAVEGVLRALVTGPFDPAKALLTVATVLSLVVPFVALWLVLRDLAQFYFHANHVRHDAGGEAFTPRFTLTGLLLPLGELSPTAARALDQERASDSAVGVLVPANDAARRNIDRRVAAYGGLGVAQDGTDRARAEALLELAASHPRTLLDEVAKVENGMARHVLRIQMIVLRYVKALLALLTTALAVFAAAGIVGGGQSLETGTELWLAGVYLVWAPVVIVAVATPVRWLEKQLRSEGATHTAVADDHELTQVEDLTVRLALAGFAAAAGAMAVCLGRGDATPAEHWVGLAVLVGGVVILGAVLLRWSDGHLARRLGRHA